ncbi:MAG: sialidase family protein, partial [Kiritimatiellaeota bacterium]|nr:sialidase family protein [Kiritimatiellota bacterium]
MNMYGTQAARKTAIPQRSPPSNFLFATFALLAACGAALAAEGMPAGKFEGKLEPFLGEPKFDLQQVSKGQRLPNVVVATDGTVLAAWGWGGVRVRRSEDGGKTWEPEIAIGKGLLSGGVTVDEKSGDILLFTEAGHPPAPLTMYRSQDHGKSWKEEAVTIQPDSKGNVPSMCMNEHGIALRHGEHKGRLLRPARCYGKSNAHNEWPTHYTTAIYSDDGGKTWQTSDPFPEMGTGEAAVAELSDGRVHYNSRRHWAPSGRDPDNRRWIAWSNDGGATWKDCAASKILPDGPRPHGYGLMGGLVRLPVADRDV